MSLGGLLLLFVASRLLYLVLLHPIYYLTSPGEELYRGAIAQELITGLTLPFPEYRANNYEGGSLVIGALAAGFFRLFGPTVFALKLAPLFLFTLALVFWYWAIRRAAGERVAGYFAVLFCFSPPLFTTYSLTAMGSHSESIAFSALTVLLLFRMLSKEKPSPAVPALLGLTAGVGLWFTYIYGLTLLALLGFWLWHDKGALWRPRFAWFALGFLMGFSPWIVINVQTHFAGLVVQGTNVWEHFGLAHLWDDLAHPLELAPVEFLRTLASDASDDPRYLPRRAVNLLYALLYLGPLLTAGVLRLKTVRSAPAGPSLTRPTLTGFAILYLAIFALAVQCSDFRATRYHVPAYPFLFFLTAYSLAYCQDRFPRVQKKIQIIFLASVVVLSIGTHAPLVSLDRPGEALSAKGYSYVEMPFMYLNTHPPAGLDQREVILQQVLSSHFSLFFSTIFPKLSSDDQRELSRTIALLLAETAPLKGQAKDFARLERLVPPGFDRYFYYQVGVTAMARYRNELPQAVAAVEFLRHRTPAMHHLALVGIYREWPRGAAPDRTPDALINATAAVAPEVSPHYWRALGYRAGRSWYDKDRSLRRLTTRVQSFVPRLEPSVQRSFLQGVGELLFDYLKYTPWITPAELERFPHAYQEGLLEGWGIALGEYDLLSGIPWHGLASPYWTAWTKGFSARSLMAVQQGKAQFEALFEGPAPSALESPLRR